MFPFGFVYIALTSTTCCMVHSMLFFWHRYELPAVALGHVTPAYPREITGEASTPVRTNRQQQIPTPRLSPRSNIPRQASFGTTGSSSHGGGTRASSSRHGSSTALFRAGDDGDESSYIFFMNGEVVMHQTERRTSVGDSSVEEDELLRVPASISTAEAVAEEVLREDIPAEVAAAVHAAADPSTPPQPTVAVNQTPRMDNRGNQEWVGDSAGTAPGIPTLTGS